MLSGDTFLRFVFYAGWCARLGSGASDECQHDSGAERPGADFFSSEGDFGRGRKNVVFGVRPRAVQKSKKSSHGASQRGPADSER